MISQLKRTLSLALAIALVIPTVFAHAGEDLIQTTRPIADGLTYVNTLTEDSAGREESFALQLDKNSAVFPITIQASGSIYGKATISKAIEEAEALGYHVVGGVNSDFFSIDTGVPIGLVIEDGIYKSSTGKYAAVAFIDNQATLINDPAVFMNLTNNNTGNTVKISSFNKTRTSGGALALMNEYFSDTSTRTTTAGWAVRMELVEPNTPLTVNGEITLKVTETIEDAGAIPIGKDNYILTADTAAGMKYVFDYFTVGDEITVSTIASDSDLIDAQWATGVGDVMIQDGTITDSEDWNQTNTGRAPRTAMGMREDGTTVFYVIDGRQSSHSSGLTQVNLADELLKQGCVWAVNLDGGGSSNLSVLQAGQAGSTVVNRPSDGKSRASSTFILLVTEDEGETTPDALALKWDGQVVLTGASIPIVGAVAVNDVGITLPNVPDDVIFSATSRLGDFNGNIYTARETVGRDTILLSSDDLDVDGKAQIHVVDSLTGLTIARADNDKNVSSLVMKAGDTIDLDASGYYWNRNALYSDKDVTWTFTPSTPNTTGALSTVDALGVFTAGSTSGTLTASAGGLSTKVKVTIPTLQTDVPSTHWSYEAVTYCYENDIISGVSSTEFGLGRDIIRGDFALILYKALGKPEVPTYTEFSDVSPTDYYAAAISWVVDSGIAAGTSADTFGAKSPITREQAFTMLNKALPLLNIDVEDGDLAVLNYFTDSDTIATYAQQATATLITHRIVSGSNNQVNPRGTLAREEMAALMFKLLNYDPSTITPITPPPVDATKLTLNRSDFILLSGEGLQLIATPTPANSTGKVTWTSSNPSAATVSENGLVTNVFQGIGQPTVTITATLGDVSVTCVVRCRPSESENTPPTTSTTGTVTNSPNGIALHSGPGASFSTLATIANGTQVTILDTLEGWYHVTTKTADGTAITGYLSATSVTVTTAPEPTPDPTPDPDPDPEPPVTPPTATQDVPHLTGKVINATGGLNLRTVPSSSGTILSVLKNGSDVTILTKADGWYHVTATTSDGKHLTGYLAASYIDAPALGTVTDATMLNVRAGADSSQTILTSIPDGTVVPVLATEGDWYKIIADVDGKPVTGYVSALYLTVV